MRIGLDSNLLVYAEGVNGRARADETDAILAGLVEYDLVIPVQVLGELFAVLVRKARLTPTAASAVILRWRRDAVLVETSAEILDDACELAVRHGLQIWDAIVLAASAEAGCRVLLSEDMHDGFAWRGTTVRNPFAPGFSLG